MKHLILLAIGLTVVGLVFLITKWPQDRSRTFSQHAAAHKPAIIYYFCLFALLLPILIGFFYGYFIPTYSLPLVFSLAIGVAITSQFIVTIFPETKGISKKIHWDMITVSVAAIYVSMAVMVFSSELSTFARIFAGLAVLVSSVLFVEVVRHRAAHPQYLYVQSLFYVFFFGSILIATYF